MIKNVTEKEIRETVQVPGGLLVYIGHNGRLVGWSGSTDALKSWYDSLPEEKRKRLVGVEE